MEYPISNARIIKIYRKEGFSQKTGKPYTKVDLHLEPTIIDDFTFSGKCSLFDYNGQTVSLKEGDSISGVLSQNGEYWNFNLPKSAYGSSRPTQGNAGSYVSKDEFNSLVDRVSKLEALSFTRASVEAKPLSIDDLPF